MTIAVENNSRQTLDFPYEELAGQVITAALDFEAFPYEAEVSLLLTDLEEIHEINRTQRGIDKPTDVLSFPMIENPAPGDFSRLEEAVLHLLGYDHMTKEEALVMETKQEQILKVLKISR